MKIFDIISPDNVIILIVIVAIFSLPMLLLTDAGNLISDYNNLDNSQCREVIINDTFSEIHGSFGSSTYYYIVTDKSEIYELVIGTNATKLYKWKSFIHGESYSIKTYKTYSESCNDYIMRK